MTRTNRECITFTFLVCSADAHKFQPAVPGATPARLRILDRVTQGSVQIELIFRLLLKITVDWPCYALFMFL